MPDPNVRTYKPADVIITWGAIAVTGIADGDFLSIEPGDTNFTKMRGADGGIDRTNKNVSDYTVTLTLKQTSITNDLLSVQFTIDKNTNLGAAPLTVKDLNGTTLFFAPQAWIVSDPSVSFGNEIGTREWVFETGIAQNFIGGNTAFTS